MASKTKRRIIVCDVESSGLGPEAVCVEVAWHDLSTDEHGVFVPAHDVAWVREHGHPDALELNGYEKRIATASQDDGGGLDRLHRVLRGQVLAGANPTFDAGHLGRLFAAAGMHPQPWHHRLLDLAAYTAGVLGLDPAGLPGAAQAAELLGVPAGDHTAAADVESTSACFRALMAKAGVA